MGVFSFDILWGAWPTQWPKAFDWLAAQILHLFDYFRCVNAWINAFPPTAHNCFTFCCSGSLMVHRSCFSSDCSILSSPLYCYHYLLYISQRSCRLLLLLSGRKKTSTYFLLLLSLSYPVLRIMISPLWFSLFSFFMRPVCIYLCTYTHVAHLSLWRDGLPACSPGRVRCPAPSFVWVFNRLIIPCFFYWVFSFGRITLGMRGMYLISSLCLEAS